MEYKGSISFRITSQKKLHKRVGRRKNSQLGGAYPSPGEPPFSPDSSFSPGTYPRQDTGCYMASSGFRSTDSSGFISTDFSPAGYHHQGYPPMDTSSSSGESPLGTRGAPAGGFLPEGASTPRSAFPKGSPGAASPKKSPPKSPGAACRTKDPMGLERTEPVTLNLIVREELNPALNCVVTKGDIANAVELTVRPINKRAVYRDLETILAHEIHLGYVLKHGDNAFSLPDITKGRTFRGTIPLKSSKRKPKPTQKYLESTQKYLEMEAELARFRQDKFSSLVRLEPAISHFEMPYPTNGTSGLMASATAPPHTKTEDELKDDLIKEKLISNNLLKMKSKMKGNKIKVKKEEPGGGTVLVKEEAVVESLAEMVVKQELVDSADEKPRSPSTKKLRLKKETWHLSDTVKLETTKREPAAGSDEGRSATPAGQKSQPLLNIKAELEEDCGEGCQAEEAVSPPGPAPVAPPPAPVAPPPAPVAPPPAPTPPAHAAAAAVPLPAGRPRTGSKEYPKRTVGKVVGKKTTGLKRKRDEDSDEELSDSPALPVAPLTRTLSGRKKVGPLFYVSVVGASRLS